MTAPDLLTHLKELEAADPGGLPYRTALIQAYERLLKVEAERDHYREVMLTNKEHDANQIRALQEDLARAQATIDRLNNAALRAG